MILLLIFSICEGTEFNPLDTLKVHENSSSWEKLSFGIGYEGGLCWTGDALGRKNPMPLDITAKLYWINSIKGNITYPLKGDKEIEIGIGYGWWPRLTNRTGLYLYLPNDDPTTGEAWVTTSYWDLSNIFLFLKLYINSSFSLGININHCIASTEEYLDSQGSNKWPSDTITLVRRECRGAGGFCCWKGSSMFGTSRLKPYLKLQLGWAKEYKNDAPWDWDDKLTVGLSGVFLGLKFEIGG